MTKGAFKSFDHDHMFRREDESSVMKDVFDFKSPMWFLGRIADAVVLKRYIKGLLVGRAGEIKMAAESDCWEAYLDYSSARPQ